MKYTLKAFGIPVLSFERESDNTVTLIQNTDGSFELFQPEEEYEDYEYEEDRGFGFRSPL